MSGYQDYSKSNNAAYAEEQGKLPLTRAIQAVRFSVGCTAKQARTALKSEGSCEWHHTSKKYNITEYYDVADACLRVIAMKNSATLTEVKPGWKSTIDAAIRSCGSLQSGTIEERHNAINTAARSLAGLSDCDPAEVIAAYYYGS